MGNALDAARISIAKGFTGVSDPTSTLSAITKGIETISDWKTKREEAKEKLKKDTSDEYLAAEKKAYENMPTDKTFKTNVLEGLESYKERLYTNMKLVQRGVVSNNDNLIFRENATQGIGIVSDMQKNYAKIQEDYLKGARGYTKEDGTFVNPIYGSGAAALNDIHVQMNNPDLYSLTFNEKGSAEVVMYETEVGPNSVMIAKRDKNGDRIPVKGADGKRASNINAMAFDGGNNQVMGIIDLNAQSAKLTGDGTVYQRDFQEIINTKGMMGVITDDIKTNKKDGLSDLIKSTAASMINGVDSQLSVLTDNGPKAEQSQSMSPAMYARLTTKQKAETIEYNYFNFKTGKMDKGEKTRFIPLKMMSNNQYVPQFQERDIEAYTNITEFSIYNSLEKSIKSAGSQTQKDTPKSGAAKVAKLQYLLLKKGLNGDYTSLKTLIDDVAKNNANIKGFRTDAENNQLFIIRADGTEEDAIDLTGNFVQTGERISAQLGISGEGFASLGLGSDLQISDKVVGYDPYSITAAATPYAAIAKEYNPSIAQAFFETDSKTGALRSGNQRKVLAQTQIKSLMDRVGLSGNLVVTEPTDAGAGGIVTLDGEEIGNLNNATTVSTIINTIIQKAKGDSGSLDDLGEN